MAARIIFMGSPEFSLPALHLLSREYSLCGVVTQPDRPVGRGRTLTPPPVKAAALELGVPVIQPQKLKDPGVFETLQSWQPDVIVVAAYGQILRQNVLDLPRFGCLNVHASLLPRWRGASPIQYAILEGDAESGVTIMRMEAGLDTGPMLSQCRTPITAEDTAGSLGERLALLGASLIGETLPRWLSGEIQLQRQDDTFATYAPLIKKEDGLLDPRAPAIFLSRKVRAFNPWPGASLNWDGQVLKILTAHAEESRTTAQGQRIIHEKKPAVITSDGILILDEVQPPGKKPMPGTVFLNGARGWANKVF
jgi:methionyl-tRNA formyltransferase